jgi:hypothetical protein
MAVRATHAWAVMMVRADIVDIKPPNMEELTEVITAADFHPSHCHQFVYSSSKGTIKLCDMRLRALCDEHAKGAWAHGAAVWGCAGTDTQGCVRACVT